jgi:hypothetical protein
MSNPLPLIQVLPLQNGALLTSNNTQVAGIDTKSIKDYQPNGSYITSSSSISNDETRPYKAFNGSRTTFWQCDYNNNPKYNSYTVGYPKYRQDPFNSAQPSTYQGGGDAANKWSTQIGDGGNKAYLSGEWIQIQLPYSIYLYKYSIMTPSYSNNVSTFPTKFAVVGSTDGKTWNYIDQHNLGPDELPKQPQPMKTINLNSTSKYSYFRLIISEMSQGMNLVRINQWNLFGITYVAVNPNVGTEKFTPMFDYTRIGNFEPFDNYMNSEKVNAKYGYKPPPIDPKKQQAHIDAVNAFQISPNAQLAANYSTLLTKIDTNYRDLSNNIAQITNPDKTGLRDQLMADNKYDFSGNLLNYLDTKPTIHDAIVEDTTSLLVQQNSVYVLATIACASVLIFTILIARE